MISHRRAVLFDLDGTLANSAAHIAGCINLARSHLNLPPATLEEVKPWIGIASQQVVAALLVPASDPRHDDVLSVLHEAFNSVLPEPDIIYDGMTALLKTLGARMPMAVVSNKLQQNAEQYIEHLGLTRYFAEVIGRDTAGIGKPDPAPLLHACQQLDVDPRDAVMVGDHFVDLEAARKAGMPGIFVDWGFGTIGDENPASVCRTVGDLREILVGDEH